MASSQLIETSEEDSSLAVARFIGDLLNDGEVGATSFNLSSLHDQG